VLPEDGTLVSKHVGDAALIFMYVYVEFVSVKYRYFKTIFLNDQQISFLEVSGLQDCDAASCRDGLPTF
jgi:hypothetical protein